MSEELIARLDSGECSNELDVAIEIALLTAQAILGDAQPMEVTQSSTSVVCSSADASVAVSVSGGKAPYQYNWNTVPVQTGSTATGLAAGIYSCMVTDAGQCTASITAEVTGSVKPVAAFTYSPVIVSLENPVCTFADASMLASEWYWDFNEPGNQKISVLKNRCSSVHGHRCFLCQANG